MLIEIIADITCPWCYIGLKRLRSALALRPSYNPTFLWRPFLLNPELRDGSIDRHHYLTRVFGSESRIQQFQDAVETAGNAVNIPFNFETADITPSSVNAHRFIAYAGGLVNPVILADALFSAYFVDGKDIGSADVIASVAKPFGFKAKEAKEFIEGSLGRQDVLDENAKIHRLGINGVPAFVFAKRNIISGAQEPEALVNVLDFVVTAERLEQDDDHDQENIRA
ncbi:MAG: DsbA family oxidoreductase [Rhodospirillales bacterium]|nr:DsbA family oxidoreductase [Rhodospirillales bacterium]